MTVPNAPIAFIDTETTGLDPEEHQIWEVAILLLEPSGEEYEQTWYLPVDLGRADAFALKIGNFHERYGKQVIDSRTWFATEFAEITRGAHLAGNVVSFDEERLRKLLRANGACPEWHYHLIDIEPMVVGYLLAQGETVELPWKSDELSQRIGVDPEAFEKHTAMGDVRWCKAMWDAIQPK